MNQLSVMILSPALGVSCKSWVVMWALMEMSSMAFITLMNTKMIEKKETIIKYFTVQSTASLIMMMAAMSNKKNSSNTMNINSTSESKFMIMAMVMKLGMVPLHMWMVSVSTQMKMKMMLLMLTWQKIMPLLVMSKNFKGLNYILAMVSVLVGTLSQMSNTNNKMLIVLSSISHMGWLMMPMGMSWASPMVYLLVYSILLKNLVSAVINENMKKISKQASKNWQILVTTLALAGMPPLMGFMVKWMVLKQMMKCKMSMVCLSLGMLATMNFYIYTRMMNNMNTGKKMMKMSEDKKKNKMDMVNIWSPMLSINILK